MTYEAHLAGCWPPSRTPRPERMLELEREAHRLTREPAPYTDVTVSFSKCDQRAACVDQGERPACPPGRRRGSRRRTGTAASAAFQEVLQAANRAALEHAQRWAGVTRTGYHGREGERAGDGPVRAGRA